MLLFSTILDINESMTKDDFIRLVIEWNQGSPHISNIIPGIDWNGERNIRFGDDRLWLAIEEYRNQNIIAARYEKQEDDGSVWDTDYVMNFTAMKWLFALTEVTRRRLWQQISGSQRLILLHCLLSVDI